MCGGRADAELGAAYQERSKNGDKCEFLDRATTKNNLGAALCELGRRKPIRPTLKRR
jgi:hypothetical protein